MAMNGGISASVRPILIEDEGLPQSRIAKQSEGDMRAFRAKMSHALQVL